MKNIFITIIFLLINCKILNSNDISENKYDYFKLRFKGFYSIIMIINDLEPQKTNEVTKILDKIYKNIDKAKANPQIIFKDYEKLEKLKFQSNQIKTYIFFYKGLTYLQLNLIDEAEKIFTRIISVNFDFPPAYLELAHILYDKKKIDKALILYLKYSKLQSNDPNVYLDLGNVYNLKKDENNSVIAYKKCIEIDTNFFRAYYYLGEIFYKQKKYITIG